MLFKFSFILNLRPSVSSRLKRPGTEPKRQDMDFCCDLKTKFNLNFSYFVQQTTEAYLIIHRL